MKGLQEQKKIIIEDFDFKRIEKVMKFLDWKWLDENDNKYSPSVSNLVAVANICLDKIIESDEAEDTFSIGGFESVKINGVLELRFIIEKNNILKKLNIF